MVGVDEGQNSSVELRQLRGELKLAAARIERLEASELRYRQLVEGSPEPA